MDNVVVLMFFIFKINPRNISLLKFKDIQLIVSKLCFVVVFYYSTKHAICPHQQGGGGSCPVHKEHFCRISIYPDYWSCLSTGSVLMTKLSLFSLNTYAPVVMEVPVS